MWLSLRSYSFGGSLFSNEHHGLLLLGNRVDQVVDSHIVHDGDENRAELWSGCFGVHVVGNEAVPHDPMPF